MMITAATAAIFDDVIEHLLPVYTAQLNVYRIIGLHYIMAIL